MTYTLLPRLLTVTFSLMILKYILQIDAKSQNNDWVTMVTVSRWYDEMFKNWWLWYKRLELGMETIVIAEDEWIFQKYQNESSFKLVYFAMEQISNDMGSNMEYNKSGFNKLTSRRSYYLLQLMKQFSKIIYTDIDTIWMKDPRPFFVGENIDFWAQIDGVIEGSPYFKGYIPFICTGFLAFQSTKTTLALLKKWQLATTDSFNQDQDVIQKIAFDLSANFGVLPMHHFPCGDTYFGVMSAKAREDSVVIHNNFIVGLQRKIQRFKNFQLWAPDLLEDKTGVCKSQRFEDFMAFKVFQCSANEFQSKKGMYIYQGRRLLSERSLQLASKKGQGDFKDDYLKYYYFAKEHWKI